LPKRLLNALILPEGIPKLGHLQLPHLVLRLHLLELRNLDERTDRIQGLNVYPTAL
jgi:hypothetical protein